MPPRGGRSCAGRAAGACGADDDFSLPEWDAPGQNARVGDIMIRYAHVAEPRGRPWQPGSDVPAYVWLYNKGGEADRLVGADTPNAASVDIVDSDGKRLTAGWSCLRTSSFSWSRARAI